MRRMMPLLFAVLLVLTCACSSVDCPLNNTVYCKYVLDGEVCPLPDTLTVSAVRAGRPDTILLNRSLNTRDFVVPMSYNHDTDVLLFTLVDSTSATITDTVRISKTSQPHFESVDCSPNYFHTLTSAEWTTHAIDSIIITKSKVTNDTTGGNIRIHFKSRR